MSHSFYKVSVMEFSQVRITTRAQIHTDFRKKNRKEGYMQQVLGLADLAFGKKQKTKPGYM